ncbi:MAG: DUF2493 domain-containing protein [Clostridia bacterium]|nr:DUF2493 domain-containing protein [Clostridia bacterium]
MVKRIVVAGCRDYYNYEEAREYIDFCINRIKNEYELIFISGDCRGTDQLGERYAIEHGYAVEHYPADWKKYGRAAGPKRNEKMAEVADYVICFWDGKSRGTGSMIKYAERYGKELKVKYI